MWVRWLAPRQPVIPTALPRPAPGGAGETSRRLPTPLITWRRVEVIPRRPPLPRAGGAGGASRR